MATMTRKKEASIAKSLLSNSNSRRVDDQRAYKALKEKIDLVGEGQRARARVNEDWRRIGLAACSPLTGNPLLRHFGSY